MRQADLGLQPAANHSAIWRVEVMGVGSDSPGLDIKTFQGRRRDDAKHNQDQSPARAARTESPATAAVSARRMRGPRPMGLTKG